MGSWIPSQGSWILHFSSQFLYLPEASTCPGHEQLSAVHPPGARVIPEPQKGLCSLRWGCQGYQGPFPPAAGKNSPSSAALRIRKHREKLLLHWAAAKKMSWSRFQWKMLLFLENCPGGEGMTREWQKPHFSLSPAGMKPQNAAILSTGRWAIPA